jgi:hypothetical protein
MRAMGADNSCTLVHAPPCLVPCACASACLATLPHHHDPRHTSKPPSTLTIAPPPATTCRATGPAKVPGVLDHLRQLLVSKLKVIVFAHHAGVLDAIQEELLKPEGVGYMRIDGKITPARRKRLVDQFQASEEVQVALLSINAAGAWHMSMWWSLGIAWWQLPCLGSHMMASQRVSVAARVLQQVCICFSMWSGPAVVHHEPLVSLTGVLQLDTCTIPQHASSQQRCNREGRCTCAGVGLTLTASHTVVFAEMAWNPTLMIQAEDRAHRLGQKSQVGVGW